MPLRKDLTYLLVCLPAWVGALNLQQIKIPESGKVWERIEFKVTIDYTAENPDDHQEVVVFASIVEPTNVTRFIPGFYYQPFEIDDSLEALVRSGAPQWCMRYTPRTPGTYQVRIHVQTGQDAEVASEVFTLQVAPADSSAKGLLNVHPTGKKYWQWSASGESILMRGINLYTSGITWWRNAYPNGLDSAEAYQMYRQLDSHLDSLIKYGGNSIRLRLDSWWQALEINPSPTPGTIAGFAGGVPGFTEGRYHPYMSYLIDRIVEKATQHDIAIMVTTWNMNDRPQCREYCTYAYDANLNENLVRRRLRYQVARWGYSRTLFAWEYFNETKTSVVNMGSPFWQETTLWLRSVDPNGDWRLVSNTRNNLPDMTDIHHYKKKGQHFLDAAKFHSNRSRPLLFGEGGFVSNEDSRQDTAGLALMELYWGQLVSHRSGFLMWHTHLASEYQLWSRLFSSTRDFLEGVDLGAYTWRGAAYTRVSGSDSLSTFGMIGNRRLGLLWIVRTPASSFADYAPTQENAFDIAGFDPGYYRITWWNTEAGQADSVATDVWAENGKINLVLSAGITRHVAVRIELIPTLDVTDSTLPFVRIPSFVAPNPSKYAISVHMPSPPLAIQMVNALGHVVRSQTETLHTAKFNVLAMPAGVYFIQIQWADHVETLRFVKAP